MRFEKTQKVLTFALALVASVPILISEEIGLFWAFLFVALAIAGWTIEAPLTWNPGYRRAVLGAILGIFAVQMTRFAFGTPMAKVGMEFSITLLGLKLLSRGWASDYQQIAILSFLQIIAATIVLDDLSYAVSFILFVGLSPPVLTLTHLRSEMEKRFARDEGPGALAMLKRLYNSKRIVTLRFLVICSLLSSSVLVITAILFVTFPRIGLGFLGRLPRGENVAGFSDEMTLGDIDIIRREETVLIRLEPFGNHRRRPDHLSLRLRGAVFDEYEGNTWKQRHRKWNRLSGWRGRYNLVRARISETTPGFEVLLESLEPPILFTPEGTGQITTYPVVSRGSFRPRRVEQNYLGMLRYKDDAKVGVRYRAFLTGAAPLGNPPEMENTYLQLPSDSQRLADLAGRLAGDGTPEQQALRLIRGLRNNYRYSIRLSDSEMNTLANTPLDRFLFTRRTGTCEHFATGLTLMLRAVGIPARTVTGFSGADWNPIGEFYAVRKRSAHSWTEAFLNGNWRTLDATPPGEGGSGWERPSAILLALDAIRMRWHKHVVGYDAAAQMELALDLRRMWLHTFGHRTRAEPVKLWPLAVLVGAVVFGAVAYRVLRNRLRVRGRFRGRGPRARVSDATAIYLRLQQKLDRLGYPRAPAVTPKEHVAELIKSDGEMARVAAKVVLRYNQVRFGNDRFEPGEVEQLRSLIRDLGSQGG